MDKRKIVNLSNTFKMEHFREHRTEYVIGLILLIPEYILFKFADSIINDSYKSPILNFLFGKIEINIVIVGLTLIILPIVVMEISSLVRRRQGLNTYNIRRLDFGTNTSNYQSTDYKEINLNNSVIRSITMKVEYNCDYIRFGFNLASRSFNIFSTAPGLVTETNFLIHIGRNEGERRLGTGYYINGQLKEQLTEKIVYSNKSTITLRLRISDKNLASFYVNGRKTHTDINIPDSLLEKLYICAWGDNLYPYSYSASDIIIESKSI